MAREKKTEITRNYLEGYKYQKNSPLYHQGQCLDIETQLSRFGREKDEQLAQILYLHYVYQIPNTLTYGISFKEVADKLRLSEDWVKKLNARAIKQFTPYVILQAGCSKPAPVMNARIEAVQ